MKNNIKIQYNPTLSIKENALNIGVSEKSVYEYMSKNDISGHDNNYNNRLSQLVKAKKYFEKNDIKPTIKNLSSHLGWSNKTVIKYQNIIKNSVENGRNTPPFITPKYKHLIKSVSQNQHEILNHILKLHIPKKKFDCDLTYSLGYFYKKGVPEPYHKFDKYPSQEDVKQLDEIENVSNNHFESVVCDPPFILDVRNREEEKTNSKMIERFFSFRNPQQLYFAYYYLIEQSYRTLKKNGILVFKCMPTLWGGKCLDVPFFVKNICYDMGFEIVDEFILVAKQKMVNTRHNAQRHALKNHCYFLIFKKKARNNNFSI